MSDDLNPSYTAEDVVTMAEACGLRLMEWQRDAVVAWLNGNGNPLPPHDCESCHTTYVECTEFLFDSGACCARCRHTDTHGAVPYEAAQRRRQKAIDEAIAIHDLAADDGSMPTTMAGEITGEDPAGRPWSAKIEIVARTDVAPLIQAALSAALWAVMAVRPVRQPDKTQEPIP